MVVAAWVVGLVLLLVVLVVAARLLRVPDPVALVLGGLAVALVPGVPEIEVDPEVFLVGVLPILLFGAAVDLPPRELKATARPVASLAVGLVVVTTAAVAVVAHSLVPGLSWAMAFVLGALVSPPDPVAATTVARQVGLPRRLATIIEGEGLFNDGTALVVYRVALGAVTTGTFSLLLGGLQFLLVVAGGVVVGLLIARLAGWLVGLLHEPVVENVVLLAIPFVAYLAAEAVEVSGVLAALTAGLAFTDLAHRGVTPAARLQGRGVIDVAVFLLTGLSFLVVGLELRPVLAGGSVLDLASVVGIGLVLCLVLVAVRVAWVFGVWALERRRTDPGLGDWRWPVVLSWTGMRGAVSLAAALTLPRTLPDRDFDERGSVIALVFLVVVVTLVAQGATLRPLALRLRLAGGEEDSAAHLARVRRLLEESALARLEEMRDAGEVDDAVGDRLQEEVERRLNRVDDQPAEVVHSERAVRAELLSARRAELARLVAEGAADPEVLTAVRVELDRAATPGGRGEH